MTSSSVSVKNHPLTWNFDHVPVMSVLEARISLARISQFLEETETEKFSNFCVRKIPSDPIVGFRDASFTWEETQSTREDSSHFRLEDLNISFPAGKLSLIMGAGGSYPLLHMISLSTLMMNPFSILSGQREINLASLAPWGDKPVGRFIFPPAYRHAFSQRRSFYTHGYDGVLWSISLASGCFSQRECSLRLETERDEVPRCHSGLRPRAGSRAVRARG